MEKKAIILDDWQKDIIEEDGNVLLCTGRQVGKTMTLSHKAGKYMIEHPNTNIIVVSLTEDQAQLIIIMILDFLERTDKGKIHKGKKKPTKSTITLTNGSKVIARPVGNTGDSVRGFTGDILIVDEASRMPELMWIAAKPTLLTTGGKIWMCSTPHGKTGYFYECFINKNNRFKVFHISSEEVIKNRPVSEGWTKERKEASIKILEEEKEDMSELRYSQEYLGLFIDDLRRYFSDELINRVCTLERPSTIKKDQVYSLGVDIARMGDDDSTFEILRRMENNQLIHVESVVTRKTLTTQTERQILNLDKLYDFQHIYLDAGSGSLGVGIFDHLLDNEQTKRKVVAINNRARPLDRFKSKSRLLKEDLYDNLLMLMEKNQIRLLDDDNIRASLRSIQYEFTKDESNQVKIFGNFSHIVEGLIRAAWIVKEKNLNVWLSSIRI